MKLYFVTSNQSKFEEVARLVPGILRLDLELDEIQDLDPKKVLAHKLTEAKKHHAGTIAVEDISLSLAGLNGLPGTMIKWFLKSLGTEGMFDLTKKLGNDRATILCSVGISRPGQESVFFAGKRSGRIVAPRAASPFGWNPIFQQDGVNKTYAEMSMEERLTISHRAIAWRQVSEFKTST